MAHPATVADLSADISDADEEMIMNEVMPTTCEPHVNNSKVVKQRTSKRVKKHVEADTSPVNEKAIKDAMAQFKMRDPELPKRGRKPVREDIYISTSLEKIEEMEKRLIEQKGKLSAKERDELRNKASALRSRVKRKIEQRSCLNELSTAKAQFAKFIGVVNEELSGEARARIMHNLADIFVPDSSTKKRARKTLSLADCKNSR